MGVYDIIEGIQVKCFIKPYIDSKTSEIIGITGEFKNYSIGNKVPAITKYYDYGKDFMIYDYRSMYFMSEIPKVIVIRDSKVSKILPYTELSKQYKIDLVVDKYGEPINIRVLKDFDRIAKEFSEVQEKYNQIYSDLIDSLGGKVVKPENLKELDVKKNLEIMRIAGDKANQETFKKFRDKWYTSAKLKEFKVNGGWLMGSVLDVLWREKAEKVSDSKVDWKEISKKISENNEIEKCISDYSKWLEMNNRPNDISVLLAFFEIYNK